jgi:hypothetical protein
MTEEQLIEFSHHVCKTSRRCTEATLRAFEIQNEQLIQLGSGLLEVLKQHGYSKLAIQLFNNMTLKKFWKLQLDLKRSYVIFTPGHALAIRQGVLFDTENKGIDNRKIEFAWEVFK